MARKLQKANAQFVELQCLKSEESKFEDLATLYDYPAFNGRIFIVY